MISSCCVGPPIFNTFYVRRLKRCFPTSYDTINIWNRYFPGTWQVMQRCNMPMLSFFLTCSGFQDVIDKQLGYIDRIVSVPLGINSSYRCLYLSMHVFKSYAISTDLTLQLSAWDSLNMYSHICPSLTLPQVFFPPSIGNCVAMFSRSQICLEFTTKQSTERAMVMNQEWMGATRKVRLYPSQLGNMHIFWEELSIPLQPRSRGPSTSEPFVGMHVKKPMGAVCKALRMECSLLTRAISSGNPDLLKTQNGQPIWTAQLNMTCRESISVSFVLRWSASKLSLRNHNFWGCTLWWQTLIRKLVYPRNSTVM